MPTPGRFHVLDWNSDLSEPRARVESLLPSLVSVLIVTGWEITLHCPLSQGPPPVCIRPGDQAYLEREEGWVRPLVLGL